MIAQEIILDGKKAFICLDIAGTPEESIEKLQEAMSCKWGHNETFALLKIEISGITTIFPQDIPLYQKPKRMK